VATLLVAFRFDTAATRMVGFPLQAFLALLGALAALWVLRTGAELRVVVGVDESGIEIAYGARRSRIPFDRLDRFEFDSPMSATRRPFPAAVLVEDGGRAWRLPAVLESGDELIEAIVRGAGRGDLEAWAESLGIVPRMGRWRLITGIGYALALVIVAAGIWFYARGPL